MPIGPLKNLPLFNGSKPSTSPGRAQQFHASQIDTAGRRRKGAVSGISHVGEDRAKASTSARHSLNAPEGGASHSIFRDPESEQRAADNRRYSHIRAQIKARQAAEKAAAAAAKDESLHVGTGASLTRGTTTGLHKRVRKYFTKDRARYRNISRKDRDFFEDVLVEKGSKKATGSAFSRKDKIEMRKKVEKARRSGKISREDSKDFKKIINKLKK